jgi:hypothetical protein
MPCQGLLSIGHSSLRLSVLSNPPFTPSASQACQCDHCVWSEKAKHLVMPFPCCLSRQATPWHLRIAFAMLCVFSGAPCRLSSRNTYPEAILEVILGRAAGVCQGLQCLQDQESASQPPLRCQIPGIWPAATSASKLRLTILPSSYP